MPECPRGEIRDMLPDLLHDRLEPPARVEVEQHLGGCAVCREELELVRSMRVALATAAPPMRSDLIAAAIPAAMNARMPKGTRGRRSSWMPGQWRVAATIALMALGGTSYAFLSGDRDARSSVAPVAAATSGETAEMAFAAAEPGSDRARFGLSMTGQLPELTEAELQAFLQTIEELEAFPLADPDPVVLPPGIPMLLESPA